MSTSILRIASSIALAAAETHCDSSELVAAEAALGSALLQREATAELSGADLREDAEDFLLGDAALGAMATAREEDTVEQADSGEQEDSVEQEASLEQAEAVEQDAGSTITVVGTFLFGLDGKDDDEFKYVRNFNGKGGSEITGKHQRPDGTTGSIVFDTDGTGIVGNTYQTKCASGLTATWKVQNIGNSEDEGNFKLTIRVLSARIEATCLLAKGGISGRFVSKGTYRGKPLFCRDDGQMIIRYGSTDGGWDWCGKAVNCEVKDLCSGRHGRSGYSGNKNGLPAMGNVFRWGGAKTTLSVTACPEAGPTPTPAPTPQPRSTPTQSPSGGADSAEANEWLSKTNAKRAQHGACAVTWNTVLADDMLKYLKTLKSMKHDNVYKLKPPHGPCGENLAWASNGASLDMAINGWYDEVNDCANPITTDGCKRAKPGKMVGHFTSMVWKGAGEMGCAKYKTFAGCRYMETNATGLSSKTPNMGGHYVRNVGAKGTTATKC